MISELRNSHLTRSVIPRSWYAEFRYEGFYCSLDLTMSNVFNATEYSSDKSPRPQGKGVQIGQVPSVHNRGAMETSERVL